MVSHDGKRIIVYSWQEGAGLVNQVASSTEQRFYDCECNRKPKSDAQSGKDMSKLERVSYLLYNLLSRAFPSILL